jgi:hypothetical protein
VQLHASQLKIALKHVVAEDLAKFMSGVCCVGSGFFMKQRTQTWIVIRLQGFCAINFPVKDSGSIGIALDCNWNCK